jgi:hypothetical protein
MSKIHEWKRALVHMEIGAGGNCVCLELLRERLWFIRFVIF